MSEAQSIDQYQQNIGDRIYLFTYNPSVVDMIFQWRVFPFIKGDIHAPIGGWKRKEKTNL